MKCLQRKLTQPLKIKPKCEEEKICYESEISKMNVKDLRDLVASK